MRRDMEYVRKILIEFTNGNYKNKIPRPEKIKDEDKKSRVEKYIYHLNLLVDAGYIECKSDKDDFSIFLRECPKLTWSGNDFLDTIENDTIWNKTKEVAIEKGFEVARMSLDVLKQLAATQAKKMLGVE